MTQWLLSPFRYIAGLPALGLGWAVMLLTSGVSYFSHLHFDGALDAHIGQPAPWRVYFLEQLIAWGTVVLFFHLVGLLLSKSQIRFIDIAGTIAFARIPMLFASLVAFIPALRTLSPAQFTPLALVASLLLLIPVIWMIAFLYQAFTVSFNLKGPKAIIGCILGLFLAEILSKFLVVLGYQLVN